MIARAEGFSPEASSDPDLHTGKRRSPVSYAMTVRDSAARQMAILLSAAMRPLEVPERRMTRYSGTDSPGNVDVVVDWERPFLLVADTGRTDTVCWAAKSGWQHKDKFVVSRLPVCICLDCWTVWPRLSRYLLIIAPRHITWPLSALGHWIHGPLEVIPERTGINL
ncbi:uncharacterized protein [Drosophila suzukii]|uniref:Uncharacterized protein isoform X1 n=1 Tax=Drosophila suzukii TaxID=28584 RepID=A0ABM4TY52_DROSZ|nr:uncharacterized protein LOC118879324 isoform X1 [Drosophila suzukii]XP_036678085.1 uncharacterized protein LOC118879329 isoform X1 [Drosophila suzukii]